MRTGVVEPELTSSDTLGLIEPGDLNQGMGLSTSQLGRVTISRSAEDNEAEMSAGEAEGKSGVQNVLEHVTGKKQHGGSSLGVWVVAIVILIAIKWMTEKAGERSEFSTVRIGFENLFIVGMMASVWFFMEKMGAALIPIHGNKIIDAIREFVGII